VLSTEIFLIMKKLVLIFILSLVFKANAVVRCIESAYSPSGQECWWSPVPCNEGNHCDGPYKKGGCDCISERKNATYWIWNVKIKNEVPAEVGINESNELIIKTDNGNETVVSNIIDFNLSKYEISVSFSKELDCFLLLKREITLGSNGDIISTGDVTTTKIKI
jgi:hypothetical protein